MPIYEYRCNDCEKDLEVIQKFSDNPLTECPECQGNLQRLTSQSAFVLKGGGWYKEGYSKQSETKSSSETSSTTASSSVPKAS